LLCFCALILPFLNSCKVFDKEEDIPAYIHIDHFDLTTDPATEGSSSHKITDAWVYLDDQLLGCYELPATLPVLASGEHEIKVRGGIKQNGISSTRVQYPFYTFYTTTVNFVPGNTTTLQPVVSYFQGTTFKWLENFESSGTTIATGPYTSDTSVVQQSTVVFEGNKSGAVTLTASRPAFFCSSAASYSLPAGEQKTWLELNYKTDHVFTVGVVSYNPSLSNYETIALYPTDGSWNKIYIDLSPQVSGHSGPFNISFAMLLTEGTSANLYLDNIKLVH
jgi:hypothetical protein